MVIHCSLLLELHGILATGLIYLACFIRLQEFRGGELDTALKLLAEPLHQRPTGMISENQILEFQKRLGKENLVVSIILAESY